MYSELSVLAVHSRQRWLNRARWSKSQTHRTIKRKKETIAKDEMP